MAEVLFGDVNPGGKLPVSFPAQRRAAAALLQPQADGAARLPLRLAREPLFPFGHGLSYTTFAYSAPTVAPARIAPDGRATVSVEVTNTGHARRRRGRAALRPRRGEPSVTRPVMELKGFRRVTLAPGERRTVTFELGPEQLVVPRAGHEARRRARPFQVMVGGRPDAADVGEARGRGAMTVSRRQAMALLAGAVPALRWPGRASAAESLPIAPGPFQATRASLEAWTRARLVPRREVRHLGALGPAVGAGGRRLVRAADVPAGPRAVRAPREDVRPPLEGRLQGRHPHLEGGARSTRPR